MVDDEIGAAVLAIRQKGADVLLVIDSCHSGSGLRDASGVVTRGVDPAVLGIAAVAAGNPVQAEMQDEADAPGQVVAFLCRKVG